MELKKSDSSVEPKNMFMAFQIRKDVSPSYTKHVLTNLQTRYTAMSEILKGDWNAAYNIVLADFPDHILTKGFYLREPKSKERKPLTVSLANVFAKAGSSITAFFQTFRRRTSTTSEKVTRRLRKPKILPRLKPRLPKKKISRLPPRSPSRVPRKAPSLKSPSSSQTRSSRPPSVAGAVPKRGLRGPIRFPRIHCSPARSRRPGQHR